MQELHSGPKHTVLVIEDESLMRKVLYDNLTAEDFEVFTAENGNEGLQEALSNRPDIILLDNRMPGMSGFEMLKRLRESNSWGEKVPVIFFSNLEPASNEERSDIESVGAAYYLLKVNTSIDELISKIREQLETSK
jgi:DNA-binding response OmpR family regulator